ncbi:uncharacterized protein FIBRA_07338 [Fibroporia radiculosa]|uniref:E3 ubiquitin-protein ligase PEP5 n=1 Tax=Fibroporia radiculosa TaxID=599839 RepID=J4GUR2_9APHY|nr:uncharacterized protein FIBRA_07338 [Fibroporia radiculosa]CCM05130.1 predicted protein [Fibroporia radiculosa]
MSAQPVSATSQQTAGLSAPAWRQFTFFDLEPVKDVHDLGSTPEVLRKAPEISTIISSSLGVVVADIHGSVYLLSREFEIIKSWLAHAGGRVTHMAEGRGVLVTLGEEDTARHPFLKVWDLEHYDKKTGAPILLRSTKVQSGSRPHPVSTIALSETLVYLAIGLADGTVLLYRHLDQSIFSGSTSLSSLPKARVVHESPGEPITGLGFREASEDNPHVYLFIVTLNRVLAYQASGRGSSISATVVSETGCALGCAVMDGAGRDIVVARDEAIFVCGTDNRGSSYAYEGPKATVHTHVNYIVIVSPPLAASASAASGTVRHYARNNDVSGAEVTKVNIFDPENKFVAYAGTFDYGVRTVFSAYGQIYVLASDGSLSCLAEKPTSVKLDLLYRRGLYLPALNMAKTQHLDAATVADIHRQYADNLYGKADYDNATQQYIATIGHLQPSYVIRKLLDAQRIHNLVNYLQELHTQGHANADHTTLLLNTYTKLKDVSRLDAFIRRESSRATDELPFDLDTAIRVCRQAGYFEHATYLAKKYERHEDYLRIQIEDAGNYRDALVYLRRLGTEAAETNLARYGRAMLSSLPDETTQLLIDICTSLAPLTFDDDSRDDDKDGQTTPTRQASTGAGQSYLSYLALNRASTPAPAPVISESASMATSSATVRPAAPSRHASIHESSRTSTPPPSTANGATSTALSAKPRINAVKRPSPRLFFAHFVDHRECLVRFLEAVALKRWGQSVDGGVTAEVERDPDADDMAEQYDQIAVWNTLLELYLTPTTSAVNGIVSENDTKAITSANEKALKLLQSVDLPYDATHALVLCSTRAFTPGLVLLWERQGMHEDVLRFWMDRWRDDASSVSSSSQSPSDEVISALHKYGPDHPHLYQLVLRFLTSDAALLKRHEADLQGVLKEVEERGVMAPLEVVRILGRNGVVGVGVVREWLERRISQARQDVNLDRDLISSYRSETSTKLRQVEELSDAAHPRVFHVTQCASCQGQLDLPSVHFMCGHSYHQRCLGEHETECPNCARAHGLIREIRQNNERLADQHDVFLQEVRERGFSALAAGFGRGAMNLSRLEEGVA